jgi:hypothetical protein
MQPKKERNCSKKAAGIGKCNKVWAVGAGGGDFQWTWQVLWAQQMLFEVVL